MQNLLGNYNYLICVALMLVGFYCIIMHGNFIKKLMGLIIFQVSVLLFYISLSRVKGAAVPILVPDATEYINPLPHVLMLTAIVVGVAVTAVGLAIAIRIKEAYGSVEEDEIIAMQKQPPTETL